MKIPPAIAAIFDLFPSRSQGMLKEPESAEFIKGKKLGFEEGIRYAQKQTITNSGEITPREMDDLYKFLVSRGLILSYDINNNGFSVRRANYHIKDANGFRNQPLIAGHDQDPGPIIMPIKVTILLKSEQSIGYEKFTCTIKGEKRIVSVQRVCFYATSLIDAMRAINLDEIQDIKIDL